MPLYEFTEGTSRRFWEVTLSGTSFTTRWGKTGTKGQEKTQRFSTAEEARREYDKRIAEKMKKGYALAEGQAAPPGENKGGMPRRSPKLEAAIAKDPDNIEGYLVYGDWLQEQGDPRGKLIALQCAAHQAKGAEATKLKKQASALVREYKQFLLGWLADKEDNGVKLEWRFGFIRGAHLSLEDAGSMFDVAEAVGALMKLPAACFLRELTFGGVEDMFKSGYSKAIHALAEQPRPTLERLSIGDADSEAAFMMASMRMMAQIVAQRRLGVSPLDVSPLDVSPLYKALPGLRELRLRGSAIELGAMNLPELREFTVRSGDLSRGAVRSIVNATWPKLERLEVWFGYALSVKGGAEADYTAELQPLWRGHGMPNLKHLGLRHSSFMGSLCAKLPGSKLLRQLQSLDLSMNQLMDDHASMLVQHASKDFMHLQHLDVSENHLSPEGERLMATLCANVATGNQTWFGGDPDDDDDGRYAAVEE